MSDRLYALAAATLTAVENGYAAASVPLPDRRYVSNGLPAWDCEQVAVYVETVSPTLGDPAVPFIQARVLPLGMRGAQIAIGIVRCVPVMDNDANPPPVIDEEGAALAIYRDPVVTLDAIRLAIGDGIPGCGGATYLGWTNLNAQGGLGGGVSRFALSME